MNPITILFIGRSGCGKGTQAKLFIDYLKSKDTSRDVFYLETGERFRQFLKEESYTTHLAKDVASKGTLQPSFLAVHIWSHIFIEQMHGGEHLVLDGTPRTLPEAQVLDTAFRFYGRSAPIVIWLDVSNDWSKARLTSRGRDDDKAGEEIDRRLEWFDTDVVPTIRHMSEAKLYTVLKVNGEQTIEDVHKEVVSQFEALSR